MVSGATVGLRHQTPKLPSFGQHTRRQNAGPHSSRGGEAAEWCQAQCLALRAGHSALGR
jgi:hypothetical protein